MLEYVFFHQRYADRFIAFLRDRRIECESRQDEESVIVGVPEGLSEQQDDEIEAVYEAMMQEHETLDSEDSDSFLRVGIQYQDPNGTTCQVRLDADLVNRLMATLSVSELQSMIQSIADEVHRGGKGRLCQLD